MFAVTIRSALSDTAINIYLLQTACIEHAGIFLSLTTCQSLAAILHPPERPVPRTHPFRSPQNAEVLFKFSFATATKWDGEIFLKNAIIKSYLHTQVVVVPGRLTLDPASVINVGYFLNYSQQDQVDPIMLTLLMGWSTHSISQLIDPEDECVPHPLFCSCCEQVPQEQCYPSHLHLWPHNQRFWPPNISMF